MKNIGILLTGLFIGSFASSSLFASPSTTPIKSSSSTSISSTLQGVWVLTKFENRPKKSKSKTIWSFSKKGLTIKTQGRKFTGTYTINLSKKPYQMVIRLKGVDRSQEAIFRVSKKTFLIKICETKKGFAKHFKVETDYDLMEFQRK